jgi:hypothetical protein
VVASTDWGEVGTEEPLQIDETGAYVDVLTVVPTLFDRRTLVVHLAQPTAVARLLRSEPPTVHALLPAEPVAAARLTDAGVSTIELKRPGPRRRSSAGSDRWGPASSPAGLTPDLDGDGRRDLP